MEDLETLDWAITAGSVMIISTTHRTLIPNTRGVVASAPSRTTKVELKAIFEVSVDRGKGLEFVVVTCDDGAAMDRSGMRAFAGDLVWATTSKADPTVRSSRLRGVGLVTGGRCAVRTNGAGELEHVGSNLLQFILTRFGGDLLTDASQARPPYFGNVGEACGEVCGTFCDIEGSDGVELVFEVGKVGQDLEMIAPTLVDLHI